MVAESRCLTDVELSGGRPRAFSGMIGQFWSIIGLLELFGWAIGPNMIRDLLWGRLTYPSEGLVF
jgi:hypothetical protein